MNDELKEICKNEDIKQIKEFVESGVLFTEYLKQTVKYNNLDALKYLASLEPVVNMGCSNNILIHMAARFGFIEIVEFLLSCPNVNATDPRNVPILWKAEYGNLKMVKRLLEIPGVIEADKYNRSLIIAARNGYLDILKLLYSVLPYNLEANNKAFYEACLNNHLEAAKYLYSEDSNINPAYDADLFPEIARKGYLEIAKYLYNEHGANFTFDYAEAFERAEEEGEESMKDFLRTIPKVIDMLIERFKKMVPGVLEAIQNRT